jgi:hypothetical protein
MKIWTSRFCCSLAVLLFAWEANAVTLEATVHFDAQPTGDYLFGRLDFGQSFSSIESVGLVTKVSADMGGTVCAASSCWSSAFDVTIYDPSKPLDFEVGQLQVVVGVGNENSEILHAGLAHLQAGRESEIRFLPPKTRLDFETGQFVSDPWQDFLFAGSAAVRVAHVDLMSWHLHGGGFNRTVRAPTTISSMNLLIEGTAVPEPASGLIAVLAAGAWVSGNRLRKNTN